MAPRSRFRRPRVPVELEPETNAPPDEPQSSDPPTSQESTSQESTSQESTGQGSIDAIIDQRIQAALGTFKPGEAIDAAKVMEIAERLIDREAISKLVKELTAPVTVKVEITQPGVETKTIEGQHYLFPRIVNLVAQGFNVVLWGPAGTGKTSCAIKVAEALGRDYQMETLDRSTFRSSILGFMNAAGKPVVTPFLTAYGKGQLAILDELDAADGAIHVLFNTALANGVAPAAWEGGVKRHAKFGFLATMNTPGRPTPDFPDRKMMGAALKDRLYFVYFPQDPAIECRAAGLPAPRAPERRQLTASPAEWVTWVQGVRAWSTTYAPTWRVGQRASLEGIKALAAGEGTLEVAHGLVFRGADEPLVAKCLAACPLPERAAS